MTTLHTTRTLDHDRTYLLFALRDGSWQSIPAAVHGPSMAHLLDTSQAVSLFERDDDEPKLSPQVHVELVRLLRKLATLDPMKHDDAHAWHMCGQVQAGIGALLERDAQHEEGDA